MIKLFCSINYFLCFVCSAPASEGWFPVPKTPMAEEAQLDEDSSVWVLFSKTIGLEKIAIRFPSDPICRPTQPGSLEIRSERGGRVFELIVEPVAGGSSPGFSDFLYELEGKWIHERIVHTPYHTYSLRTQSDQPDRLSHQLFVSSFQFS